MNTLLEINYNETLGFTDALSFGGKMFLLGILAVFAVLGIIYVILSIFKSVFGKINEKESATTTTAAPSNATVLPAYTAETEIVAVIAAAVAMAEAESGNGAKFRVVSFRRK